MSWSLSKYFSRFSSKRGSGRRLPGPDKFRKRLHLECLEGRVVPSILYSSMGSRTIVDQGGPILSHMQLDLIFWGSGWNSGGGPGLRTSVQNSATAILNSPYFDGVSQYRGIGHGSLLRSDTITTTNPGATFTTGDVGTFVTNNINNNTLPSPNGQLLYFVVPQPGSTATGCGCSGRHLAGIASGNRVFPYGFTTDDTNISLDTLSVIMSHEMAEAVSDPEWNISIGGTNQSAFYASPNFGDEIGDGEAQNYTFRVNGALVQSLDSQRDRAFIVTNGSTNNFLVSSAGVLSFQEFAFGNNFIEISRVGNGVYATLNSSTAQFEPGSIHGILVNGLSNDSINIYLTGADAPVTVSSTGRNTVNIGYQSSVQGILGTVTINNPPTYTTINVEDSSDTSARTVTVTNASITGLAPAAINFVQSDLANLTILGGSGANTFNVLNTPNNGQHPVTTLHTGAGGSTVNVRATAGALTIDGDGSTITVNVGSQAPSLNGTMANINGAVSVTNTSSTSTLSLDDSADTTARTATISGSSVAGLSPAPINYNGGQLTTLTVRGGSSDTFNVTGTSTSTDLHPGASATVNVRATTGALTIDGDGSNAVAVNVGSTAPTLGGTLANITGAVTVTNTSLSTLTVDDSGDNSSRTATLSDSAVSGLSPAPINYTGSGLSTLTVYGGSGGNTFNVTDTSTATDLHPGGSATVNVRATTGALTIDGDGSNAVIVNVGSQAPSLNGTMANINGAVTVTNTSTLSTLSLDDSGDASASVATISGTAVTGLSPAAVNYNGSQLASLTVHSGSGGAAVTVAGTSTATSLIGDPTGSNTLVGPNNPTTWNITGADSGNLSGLNFSFSSYQNLTGGAGDNAFVFSDGAFESGTVTGGGGNNTLDTSAYSSGETFLITSPNAGAATVAGAFAGIQNLIGGAAGSNFVFSDGAFISGSITGGGGGNTLDTSAYSSPQSFLITSPNAGAATVVPAFAGIQNLIGGAAGNTFAFGDGASVAGSIVGSGVDSLDYTPYTTTVIVDLQTGFATGVGGSVSGVRNVTGGSGAPVDSSVYNLLIGNGGNTLTGGTGRRNLLVAGGSGPSTLNAADGEDLLIGGTTAYDTEAGLASWQAIAAEWARTDEDYNTRVSNVTTGNGVPLLDATTVTGNGGGNTMNGMGALALIYTDGADAIGGFDPGSQQVTIAP
jgi:hypothetical protein